MLKQLIDDEKRYLNDFFDRINLQVAEEILDALYKCQGLVFFTGIGKSEAMAKKIAVTMTSTGTRALFIAPVNALHGDIGIVSERDVFVMLSKSGESEELINLVPFVRNKGAKTIAIVSNSNSRLVRACDMHILLPMERELCPFNLVPTVSSQIQMIFGDLLTIALMRRRDFNLDEYAQNHPSGKIGRRITTRVQDLMLKDGALPICHPQEKLVDTLVELSKKRCGAVFIVDKDRKLLGIFTDGDLGRALNSNGAEALETTIDKLMTVNPRRIGGDVLAIKAVEQMEENPQHPITLLAVTDSSDKLVGAIKLHDIIQAGL